MEIQVIESFDEFQQFVSSTSRKNIFRGVKDSDKHLLRTAIGRAFERASGSTGFPSYERGLFTRFRERSLPYLTNQPESELEWLALAQHHGLPTRLLDWSYNPLVALYFATQHGVEDSSGDTVDCAVYAYRPRSKTLNSTFTQSPFEISRTIKYRPSHFSDRIVAQRSVFTLHHDPRNTFDDDGRIVKLVIIGPLKPKFREYLRIFGVGASTLFPGLDGLALELSDHEN